MPDATGLMKVFPLLPHMSVPGVDCRGYLIVRAAGADESELVCNECGALLLRGNSWILSDIVGLIPLIDRQANRR